MPLYLHTVYLYTAIPPYFFCKNKQCNSPILLTLSSPPLYLHTVHLYTSIRNKIFTKRDVFFHLHSSNGAVYCNLYWRLFCVVGAVAPNREMRLAIDEDTKM